jgi:hypothetical protein
VGGDDAKSLGSTGSSCDRDALPSPDVHGRVDAGRCDGGCLGRRAAVPAVEIEDEIVALGGETGGMGRAGVGRPSNAGPIHEPRAGGSTLLGLARIGGKGDHRPVGGLARF